MERLGHSTINVTLGTYGHLFPGIDDQLNDALGARYARSTDAPGTQQPIRARRPATVSRPGQLPNLRS